MNQQSRVSAFLHQIRILPLSAFRLSRGKRLLIVTLCYGLGEAGLWFLFPLVHNGATMFLPIVSACWLFRYRGLLVSLVLNGVAFQLTYLFLLRGMLPGQAFVEGGIIGFGTSLGLGLVVCWLRTVADHVHMARESALAAEQKHRQALHPEHQIMLADEYQYKPNEESDQSPLAVLGGSLGLPKEQQEHLDLMTQVDVLTGVTPLDQQEVSLGRQIGQYRLVRKLGSGSFGTVYLAQHQHEHTQVAVKLLQMTKGKGFKDFLNEACTMWLHHPHIVPLLDFGINADDLPFIVMEYAPEGTLRDLHPKGERIPLFTIVSYVDQLATALQYAHDQHVIHRDVKPANILVRANGTLMMSDFGLAKLLEQNAVVTSVQTQVGTPAYMAPEQYRGYPCFASDQYALAVVVYEWICGVRPFQGPPIGLAFQHMNTPPQRLRDHLPELSEAIERVIFKALAKNPAERFKRIEEFAHALRQAVQAPPILSTPVEVVMNTAPLLPSEQVSQLTCDPQSEPLVRDTESVHLEPGTKTTHVSGSQPSSSPLARHAALYPRRAQIPIRGQAKVVPEPPPPLTLQHQNRMRLLQRVRSFWITGVLEQSLHGTALMALGLQEQPDAVANPWRLIMQESERASTPLPAGTRITEVYDKAGGELLILGEPGAGKTTLLLELARDLLRRAEQEQTQPIPVVFNLSSWIHKRQPLPLWLIEELETKYKVPRRVASDWINANQIQPLLDGLDEVDAPSRTACMQAINEYHQTHNLVPLVVCCRVNEYLSQRNYLELSRAITIQPLTTEQIHEYFAHLGGQIASLRIAFENDPVLQELATTPLMLNILILTYQGASVEEIEGGTAEVRKPQIFATYTQRMLRRRSARSHYEPQQTILWLSHLARQMRQQGQTVFYVERMQPSWLMKKWQRRLYYGLIAGPMCGLLVGLETLGTSLPLPLIVLMIALIVGLLFGWLSEPGTAKKSTKTTTRIWMLIRQRLATSLENRVKVGVVAGFVVGISTSFYQYLGDFSDWSFGSKIAGVLTGGLLNGMYIGVCVGLVIGLERRIEPLEVLSWSWTGMRRDILRQFLIGTGLLVGLIFALSFMILSHDVWLANFLSYALSTGFSLGLVVVLVSGVTRGLSKRVLDAQHIVTPNQGTWCSARYGVIMATITGGIAAVFTGASDFIAYFWLPLHMGKSIKPLDTDSLAVSMMSHLLGFYSTTWREFWALHALFWGLVGGAIPALAVGLSCGGVAYVQHFVLRSLLWCARHMPFNCPRFLDYAAERILLRKVGGGYIFTHRLLLEYFADLEIGSPS